MSAWICGCDPEAGHECGAPDCTYRRYLTSPAGKILPTLAQVEEFRRIEEGVTVVTVGAHHREAATVYGPGSENMAEACKLVNGPRQADYGTPRENYEGIARVWSGILFPILKRDITAAEAALMMVGLKVQRQAMKHKRDNLVDSHGYLLVYEHIVTDK